MRLVFGPDVPPLVRRRIDYAFRVFAAVYGHSVSSRMQAEAPGPGNGARVFYGTIAEGALSPNDEPALRLPYRYRPRPAEVALPSPEFAEYAGETIPLFYGRDPETGTPDLLAEIFEWLSGGVESGVASRDSVGRLDYYETLHGRGVLSPQKPYASYLMAWLESLRKPTGRPYLPAAPSPVSEQRHFIVCSHDVDFYFTDRFSSLKRILKNLAIATLATKSPAFFWSSLRLLAEWGIGRRVGDFLPRFCQAAEASGFRSTFFVIPESSHRRDANYRIEQIAWALRETNARDFTIGVHGSYKSIVENGSLPKEASSLKSLLGRPPKGNRQHWLRFDRADKLFEGVRAAGFEFDSTLGFSETAGFRNGASFAFPPYDFSSEAPYPFLEIPLILMDSALATATAYHPKQARELADRVLEESRRWGWGGVSLLWHNPIEPLCVSHGINRIFWDLAAERERNGDVWMSGEEFLAVAKKRYVAAGLLGEASA